MDSGNNSKFTLKIKLILAMAANDVQLPWLQSCRVNLKHCKAFIKAFIKMLEYQVKLQKCGQMKRFLFVDSL